MAGMAAEITNGVPKTDSRFQDIPGFDDDWEGLVVDIGAIDGMVEFPAEIE